MKKAILLSALILTQTLSVYAHNSGHNNKNGCSQYEPNWTLIDDYNYTAADGSPTSTYPLGMYVSKVPAGKVYVSAASIYQNGNVREVKGFIRRSVNFGGNFNTSNFIYNSETGSLGVRIIQAPNNKVLYFSEGHVFSSSDLANNFLEIANMNQQIPFDSIHVVGAVVKNNTIYAAANGKGTVNGQYNWRGLLLKSTNNGVTWSLVKSFSISDQYITWLTSVDVDSNGRVYVAGYYRSASQYYWMVQKSNSAVSAWVDIETQLSPGDGLSYVRAIKVNSDNELVALGPLSNSSGNYSTYVRKYSGNTVSTVYQSSVGLQGSDLFMSESGDLFFPFTSNGVAGMAMSTNDGDSFNETWSTIDFATYSYEMGEDSKNSLYVTTQDNTNLKIYKRECKKTCHH